MLQDTLPEPEASPARIEYTHRLKERRRQEAAAARRHRRIANARVAVFLAAALLAWLAYSDRLAWLWLALPVGVYALLAARHEGVSRQKSRAARAALFYEHGLTRLNHAWRGSGQPGARYLDERHPSAVDLDVFGTGSLFELLCTARTRTGEDTLAAWLCSPAGPEEICGRQAAVAELRNRLDLREELFVLGSGVPAGVDLARLAAWATAPAVHFPRGLRLATTGLAALASAGLVVWIVSGIASLLVAALAAEAGFVLWLRRRTEAVIGPVERRARDLALFAGVLARLESEPLAAPLLGRIRAALDVAGLPPSRRIARLSRLIDWLDARRNQFFAPFAFLLLWTAHLAFALEAWRAAIGGAVGRWLAAVGEFEALCALAAYAYENPADPFPEVAAGPACFEGEGLGHPLLPADRCVRNDVRLGGELRLLMVSGSNMSGKSTLLRTVGVNTILALAGAPVRARRLRLAPLALGATLRIQDSLQAGRSRFFAEITRLRQLLDLARGSPPLLFLLDELLQGTNSHDRRLGAEAIVRAFLDHGAIGLVTTHDLALTQIADRLAPRAVNVHFEDHFENGRMTFDYRLRPGIVQKSNALALMRAVGIQV